MSPLELNLGPLLPEHPEEIIVGIVLFLIIWWVVAKKVVPVFEKTYAERTAEIAGGIEKAEAVQAEADKALAEHQAQLAASRAEAARIREEAKEQGVVLANEIREQAQADSARLLASARAQVEAERSLALASLRADVGGLATKLAGRIVGEALEDDARAKRSVDRFIAEIEAETQVNPA